MNLFKFKIFLLLTFSIFLTFNAFASDPYSKQMANAQMKRSGSILTWDYPSGLFVESVLKVYDQYGGDTYYNYALNYAKATVSSSGKIAPGYSFTAYTLDNINPGKFLMQVYAKENTSQYKVALDTLRKQLSKHPRTNNSSIGGFWHKNSYPNQMWLDGLYMGTRFYANYEKTFNNGASYDDIVNQFVLIHSKTYDSTYQLNYHAWSATPTDANSFWANQSAPFLGCSKEFWGRGMGWYAAALVDVLEILPANYPRRPELVTILNQVAAGIKRWQDPVSGCWYQLLRYDNTKVSSKGTHNFLESSASCMFTYALLKACRLGLIDSSVYSATATKAYNGLITNFIGTDINGDLAINGICSSAGLGPSTNKTRDGSVDYYLDGSDAGLIVSNDLKGVGPFIMASVEYELWIEATTGITEIQPEQYRITTAKNTLTIHPLSNQRISSVSIYNTQGAELRHWQGSEMAELRINLPTNSVGIYFLQINNGEFWKVIFSI
jgi:unsaturated rhamnogalacturonyl hydrolase